jgi:hypothetical protein
MEKTMKQQIAELMNTEMTRKEFLQHVGAAILVVLGVSAMLGALQPRSSKNGYGSSAYGGTKR